MPRPAASPFPAGGGRPSVRPWLTGTLLVCLAAVAGIPSARAWQVDPAGSPADVAAIRAAATAYREALARGDADAVKSAWTADGDIVDGWGNRIRPQDDGALAAAPEDAGTPRPEIRPGESRLRFITADVAVEDGTIDVVLPGTKTPIEGSFSALWVRRGGAWKLAGLRESERPVVADATMLEDLDWLVGDWEPEADGSLPPGGAGPTMRVRWDAGRSFLVRDALVPVPGAEDGTAVVEIHQRIGWDPIVRRIRSWSFSSDGGRGEATWFRDGDSWVAVHTAVLPDGRTETSVNIFSHDGRDRCVWRILPDALDADDDGPARTTWVRTSKGVDR